LKAHRKDVLTIDLEGRKIEISPCNLPDLWHLILLRPGDTGNIWVHVSGVFVHFAK